MSKSATPKTSAVFAVNETPTATSAAGIPAPVAVPGEVIEIATLVARGTASARAISPGAEAVARAAIASGGTGLERSRVDAGYVNGLGLVVVASGDSELDSIALEESAVAVGSDGGMVNEEILAAVVGLEAEALAIFKPKGEICSLSGWIMDEFLVFKVMFLKILGNL